MVHPPDKAGAEPPPTAWRLETVEKPDISASLGSAEFATVTRPPSTPNSSPPAEEPVPSDRLQPADFLVGEVFTFGLTWCFDAT